MTEDKLGATLTMQMLTPEEERLVQFHREHRRLAAIREIWPDLGQEMAKYLRLICCEPGLLAHGNTVSRDLHQMTQALDRWIDANGAYERPATRLVDGAAQTFAADYAGARPVAEAEDSGMAAA